MGEWGGRGLGSRSRATTPGLLNRKPFPAEYGLALESPVDAHWDDVRAYVVESHGRLGPTAIALTTLLLNAAAKWRVQALHQPWGVALLQQQAAFFDKLSVVLLRNAWAAYRRCADGETPEAMLVDAAAPTPPLQPEHGPQPLQSADDLLALPKSSALADAMAEMLEAESEPSL